MSVKKRFADLPIRTKLTLTYSLTAVLILLVNAFAYININHAISRLDAVYVSNIDLNDLSASLDEVQNSLKTYLDTKSTEAMDGYYKAYQDFETQISDLTEETSYSQPKRMERNIRKMSEKYLTMADAALDAKRGRNIERYRMEYDRAAELYRYLRTYINSLNNEMFRSNSADYSKLSVSLNYIEIANILIFVAVTVINIFLVVLIVNRITRPLASLAQVAERVAEGDYDVRVPEVDVRDETGVLNETFGRMLNGIRDGVVAEAHLRDAQLKFLQAQINPHFLFNTLNAGSNLAMMEGADRTYTYVKNVADFFRYTIKKMDAPVTLSEEISMTDNYIYIINIRFAGEIKFEKEVDESLLSVKLPAMTLQPIVENAVNHGVRNILGHAEIRMKVYREEGGSVHIEITDNGEGMTQDQINDILRRKITDPDPEGKGSGGIGLHNVIGRLKLLYDTEDVCRIESEGIGKGTTVILRLPYNEGEI